MTSLSTDGLSDFFSSQAAHATESAASINARQIIPFEKGIVQPVISVAATALAGRAFLGSRCLERIETRCRSTGLVGSCSRQTPNGSSARLRLQLTRPQ